MPLLLGDITLATRSIVVLQHVNLILIHAVIIIFLTLVLLGAVILTTTFLVVQLNELLDDFSGVDAHLLSQLENLRVQLIVVILINLKLNIVQHQLLLLLMLLLLLVFLLVDLVAWHELIVEAIFIEFVVII